MPPVKPVEEPVAAKKEAVKKGMEAAKPAPPSTPEALGPKDIKLEKDVAEAVEKKKDEVKAEEKVEEEKKDAAKAAEKIVAEQKIEETATDKKESFARHEDTDDKLREARKAAFKDATSKDSNTVHFFEYDNAK